MPDVAGIRRPRIRKQPAIVVSALVALILAAAGLVALIALKNQDPPGTPEERLAEYFATLNSGDRIGTGRYFRTDELGAEAFIDQQLAGAPYTNLRYTTSKPFGDDFAQVIVTGTSRGLPFNARYDLSLQPGQGWMLFLGTQSAPSTWPTAETTRPEP
jgi:hypothetical protein